MAWHAVPALRRHPGSPAPLPLPLPLPLADAEASPLLPPRLLQFAVGSIKEDYLGVISVPM